MSDYDIQDIVSFWDEVGRREINLEMATESLSRAKKELRVAIVQLQKEVGPEEPAFDYHHLGAEEITYADEIESEDCICVSFIMDSCPATKHTYLQKQYTSPHWRCICDGQVMSPLCRATEHTGLRSGVILECTCEKGTVLCHAKEHKTTLFDYYA